MGTKKQAKACMPLSADIPALGHIQAILQSSDETGKNGYQTV
jgi:hypothetical protein